MPDMKITVIKHDDIWKVVNASANTQYLAVDKTPFKFMVTIPAKAYEKCDNDPLLQQKIWDPASALYKEMIKKIAESAKSTEKEIIRVANAYQKHQDANKWSKEHDALVKGFASFLKRTDTEYQTKMQAACEAAWAKYCKMKADIKKFKIKTAAETTLRSIAIGFNITKLVLTSGADGFAWHGLVKDTVKVAVDLSRLGRSLDSLTESIIKECNTLSDRINKGKKTAMAAEASGALLIVALGNSVGTSAQNTMKMLKVQKARVDMLDKSSHATAKTIQKLLTEVNKEMTKWDKVKAVYDQLTGAQKDLSILADKVIDIQTRCADYRRMSKTAEDFLGDFMSETNTKYLDDAIKILDTVTSLGKSTISAASGDWETTSAVALRVSGWVNNAGKMIVRHEGQVQKLVAAKS